MINESWKWVKTGQGRTKTITSKRSLYIFNGGTEINRNRGRLCVLKFGLSDGYWIVQTVSGEDSTEFCSENNLIKYEGE